MLKSIGKKVEFAAVFMNIARRWTLPEEAYIYIAEMTEIKLTLKEIHKNTITQSSMQFIKYKKENHMILNQVYDILAYHII